MSLKSLSIALSCIIPLYSCTNIATMSSNQRKDGHHKLYSHPQHLEKKELNKERYTTFALAVTNDLSGQLAPKKYSIPNRFKESRTLKIGGIEALKAYKNILDETYQGQFLFIDSGSFLDQNEDHLQTQFLRNYLGYDIGGISSGEFELFSPPQRNHINYLETITKETKFELVLSNVFDLKKVRSLKMKGVKPYSIIEKSGVKFGFINIILPETSDSFPEENINGVYFQNPAKKVITSAKNLKRAGAQVIILMANANLDCSSKIAQDESIPEEKVNFDPLNSSHCNDDESNFFKVLSQIPPKTIDLILSTGKSKVANFINGYPIIQNFGEGKYLSWTEIVFDKKHKAIDTTKTKLFQPIKLCHSFLKDTQDCYMREDFNDKEITPAVFLGKEVKLTPVTYK